MLSWPHANLSLVLSDMRKYGEAMRELHTATALEPLRGVYHVTIGNDLRAEHKETEADTEFEKAIALCQRGIEDDSDDEESHLCLADALGYLHRYGDAIKEYQIAINLVPTNQPAHNNFGNTLREAKSKLDDAEVEHRKAIELDPESRAGPQWPRQRPLRPAQTC